MEKTLLPSGKLTVRPKWGQRLGPVALGRWEEKTVEFPEINARKISENIYYSPGLAHALFSESQLYTDHSLVASLHPSRKENISASWSSLIKNKEHLAIVTVNEPVYIAGNEGSGTWGHWLVHNLPRIILLMNHFPDLLFVIPADYKSDRFKACLEVLDAFGLARERIIFIARNQLMVAPSCFLVDLPYSDGLPHPFVFDIFKNFHQHFIGMKTEDRIKLNFIKRAVENREIANWSDVETLFENKKIGITSTLTSLAKQVEAWTVSESVSAVLGSDLTNMIIGDAKRVFVLSPNWFGDQFFYGLAAGLNIEWNEMCLDSSSIVKIRDPKHRSSFNINVNELDFFINFAL